jgi:hypothetical protein
MIIVELDLDRVWQLLRYMCPAHYWTYDFIFFCMGWHGMCTATFRGVPLGGN